MTRDEARSRATEIAAGLNWPWDTATIQVRSWRVWPFARVWQVKSCVEQSNTIAFMRINDRSRAMISGRVTFASPATPTAKKHNLPLLWSVIDLLLGEVFMPVYSALFLLGLMALVIGRRCGSFPTQTIGWCLISPLALWFLAIFGVVMPLDYVRRRFLRWQSRKNH